jgi:hypothetical protein
MFSKAMPFQCPTETSLSGVVSTVPCETKIEIQIRNSFDNVSVSKNISIVEALYENPKVDIINKQKFFYLPMKKHRSDLITLVSEVTLPNIANKANTKGWKCHTVNKETGLDIKQINFTDNPTFDYAELVIRPNVLIYALYRCSFYVKMESTRGFDEASSFIEVEPAGIVVFGLENGMSEVGLGLAQTIQFKPNVYSYDLDGLQDASQLVYKIHCQVIDDGIAKGYPQTYAQSYDDLLMFKQNTSLVQMNSDMTCFDNPNEYQFDNNNQILTLQQQSLKFKTDRIYEFLITTNHLNRIYSQTIRVQVLNYTTVPSLSLKCKFASSCKPYPDHQRVNPNSKLMISGNCAQGCASSTVTYLFKMYRYWSSSQLESWNEMANLANFTNGTTTRELTIYKEFFSLIPSVRKYKIDFIVDTVEQSTGFVSKGTASLVIVLNDLPIPGTCSIGTTTGTSPDTLFTVTCTGWTDPDGYIAKYSYYAITAAPNAAAYCFGYSQNGIIEAYLPQGYEEDNYKLNIFVEVSDNDDGITKFEIPNSVVVEPNMAIYDDMMLAAKDGECYQMEELFTGSSQASIQKLLATSTVFNSVSDKQSSKSSMLKILKLTLLT